MRAIDQLTEGFPSPERAIERGIEDDWPEVQERIGSVLPRDYKDFINSYGSVYVNRFLQVHNPFSERPFVNLYRQVARTLSAWRELKTGHGSALCPYPLWFEPGGLLPWGLSDNGDGLFWLTEGHPDQWTVVLNERGGDGFEVFGGSMVEFLIAFLTRSLDERFFGGQFNDAPMIEPLAPID
jgi:hypothetical protein